MQHMTQWYTYQDGPPNFEWNECPLAIMGKNFREISKKSSGERSTFLGQ